MNKWMNERMKERKKERMNEWMNEWMKRSYSGNQWTNWFSESVNPWSNESVNPWTHESMNQWTNERKDGWMDGWVGGWMDACMHACMHAWMNEWMKLASYLLYWATSSLTLSSLSYFFSEQPLIWATCALNCLPALLELHSSLGAAVSMRLAASSCNSA